MGTNTAHLREQLLTAGRITQIVDLPSGIWKDANVDCALLFLTVNSDAERRRAQQTVVFSLAVRDTVDKLTSRRHGAETFTQSQDSWTESSQYEINIRWSPLLSKIEETCRIVVNNGPATKVQRIGDITNSTMGLKPFGTTAQRKATQYILPRRDLPNDLGDWKPLLDGDSFVGRYELRLASHRPYLRYGSWLDRPREPRYFTLPKIILIRFRNRALKRRLVGTYDESGVYSRENYCTIISDEPSVALKYILALFNSSLLNYWYARRNDRVTINPSLFRSLPIYPADAATQAVFVALVDELLAKHAALNALREQGFSISNATREIMVPYDVLLGQMRQKDPTFPVYTLFDARAAGLLRLPQQCDSAAQISRVFTPNRYPNTVVLRAHQLWLEVDDADIRRYLLNYLARPQWKGRSWDEISSSALLPEPPAPLVALFAEEARIAADILATVDAIAAAAAEIDNRLLDLYGITDTADRARVLGSAPVMEDAVSGGRLQLRTIGHAGRGGGGHGGKRR